MPLLAETGAPDVEAAKDFDAHRIGRCENRGLTKVERCGGGGGCFAGHVLALDTITAGIFMSFPPSPVLNGRVLKRAGVRAAGIVLALLVFGVGAARGRTAEKNWEPAALFIPDAAAVAADAPGPRALERLQALEKEKVLDQLERWQRISELPAWVRDPKRREVWIVPPRPLLIHDYRYAVVVGRAGEMIVVRAGGQGDRYEFFIKPQKGLTVLPPDAGGGPSAEGAPAAGVRPVQS